MARILLAEDNDMIRDSILEAFPAYDFVAFNDGKPAFERLLVDREFDLVITDFSMPEMSGADLLRAIRNHRIPIKVMLMSCFVTDELSVASYLKEGFDDAIAKPFDLHVMSEKIHKLTEGHYGGQIVIPTIT